jgi:hypothetical protein
MSAAEDFTPEEASALLRALVKVVGPEKLAKLAHPQAKVVRDRPKPRPEDFELVDKIRRRKGIR